MYGTDQKHSDQKHAKQGGHSARARTALSPQKGGLTSPRKSGTSAFLDVVPRPDPFLPIGCERDEPAVGMYTKQIIPCQCHDPSNLETRWRYQSGSGTYAFLATARKSLAVDTATSEELGSCPLLSSLSLSLSLSLSYSLSMSHTRTYIAFCRLVATDLRDVNTYGLFILFFDVCVGPGAYSTLEAELNTVLKEPNYLHHMFHAPEFQRKSKNLR